MCTLHSQGRLVAAILRPYLRCSLHQARGLPEIGSVCEGRICVFLDVYVLVLVLATRLHQHVPFRIQ